MEKRQVNAQESAKGIGGVIKSIKDKTLELTPDKLFTSQVVAMVFLFLIVAFLIYAWLEQRKKNNKMVVDASKYNIDRNTIVTLVPKKKYLLDQMELGYQLDLQRDMPRDTRGPSVVLQYPYQYPPLKNSNRLRR